MASTVREEVIKVKSVNELIWDYLVIDDDNELPIIEGGPVYTIDACCGRSGCMCNNNPIPATPKK